MSEVNEGIAIMQDFDCTGCGYNLRSLPLHGLCPECAQRIARSVEVHRAMAEKGILPLAFSDTGWLKRISIGLSLMLIVAPASAVMPVFFRWSSLPLLASVTTILLSQIVLFIGIWLVTSREPRIPENRMWAWCRIGSRILSLLAILLFGTFPFIIRPLSRSNMFNLYLCAERLLPAIATAALLPMISTTLKRAGNRSWEKTSMLAGVILTLSQAGYVSSSLRRIKIAPSTWYIPTFKPGIGDVTVPGLLMLSGGGEIDLPLLYWSTISIATLLLDFSLLILLIAVRREVNARESNSSS